MFHYTANCCTRALEGIVDVVGVVLQAEPEAGFLKDANENIGAQETKDKPTLVGTRFVRLNCQAFWQLVVLLLDRVHHGEDRLAGVVTTLATKVVCH